MRIDVHMMHQMRIYEVSSRQFRDAFRICITTRPRLMIVYFLMKLIFRVFFIIRLQIIGTYQAADQLEYATNIYFIIY